MMEVVPDEIYVKIILREKGSKGEDGVGATGEKVVPNVAKSRIDVKKDLAVRNMAGNRYKLEKRGYEVEKRVRFVVA